MAEPVNVVFSVSERGFDKILRDVEALRSDLEGLGIDMSAVQRRLNGIETTAVKTGRAIRETGKSSDDAAKSSRGWAESLTTVWARQFREAERAEAQIKKVAAAQRAAQQSAQGGRNYQNASTAVDGVIAGREQAGKTFSNQLRAQMQQNAKAADDEARAISNATRATNQRTKAEYDLNRARSQRNQRNAIADWDAEFQALDKLTSAQEEAGNPSTRYALYDVANAYAAIGTALVGVALYAGVVGADFQSAFTNVARTTEPLVATEEYLQDLRNSLVQLSGQIPLTFRELSEIATLGNQLGIAEDNITGFTDTVARFSSVSGVSIDEVSRSFGGFLAQTGLSEKYLENLGAAMSLVSVRSNATEAQIISLSREIAATANSAGFTADEIVGLAGAFASLQVAPERARGVLDTYFARLNAAVGEGGEALSNFSRITGLAGDEIDRLVRRGDGVEVFRAVLAGLKENSADSAELSTNLESLGLSGLRASNTFLRFVNALGVADESFANAREGFIEGAELNRQYAQTVDDLSSQFVIFINGINALVDAVSGGGVESLAGLLQAINNVIFATAEWLGNNRVVAWVIGFALAVAGITGALFLVRSGLILATAATLAMRTATAQMGGAALASTGTLRGLAGALVGVAGAGSRAAFALNLVKRTLPGLLITGAIVGLGFLADKFLGVDDKAGDAALSMSEYEEATKFAGLGSDGAAGSADGLADSLGGGGGGVAGAAEEAAVKVRTLVDYVNDLNGVFRRSEDLRFGSAAALDEITLKWISLNEEIEKYQAEVRSLTADRKLKEYFLGIAEAYDDQLRAGVLREDIAKIDDDLAKAQAGASTELTGNSRAAIENRKAFRDLLGSYEDYISALSSAGASQEQIQQVISQLNGEFGAQATALGFNAVELDNYGQRFADLSTIVAQVPRNVTVGFDANPALQALGEFFAKAEEDARNAGGDIGNALGDGVGGGLGGFDPFPSLKTPLESTGRKTRDWWDTLWDVIFKTDWPAAFAAAAIEIGATIYNFFTQTLPAWNEGGIRWITELGMAIGGAIGDFFATLDQTFRVQATALGDAGGRSTGDSFGRGLTESARSSISASDPVAGYINSTNNNAYNNGRAIGGNIGGGIAAGLSAALAGKQVGASFRGLPGASNGGYIHPFLDGYSAGGYTGPGHWLKPAGVVHAGEYVIPKKHVDQRTKLPDSNYVANLQRGRSAPKSGYATGGHVSGGGGFTGPIELGPASLGFLSNALSVRLNVGREQLASAASEGNKSLAFAGSN